MFVITKQVATDIAKAMRREAAARGIAAGHSSSLDRTARALGFRDFNGLSAAMKAEPVQLEPEGDGRGHLPLFHMMSRHSSEFGFRVVSGLASDGVAAPGFRTAHEMAAAWLGTDGGANQEGTAKTLAITLVATLLPAWVSPPAVPASPVVNGETESRGFVEAVREAGSGGGVRFPLRLPVRHGAVLATVRTDDGLREAEFDASGYFEVASDDDLRELHSIGFRGDYAADNVAWHFDGEGGDEGVTAVLDYDQEVARCGFEVVVDPESAMTWIATNRAALHASLTATEKDEAPTRP